MIFTPKSYRNKRLLPVVYSVIETWNLLQLGVDVDLESLDYYEVKYLMMLQKFQDEKTERDTKRK